MMAVSPKPIRDSIVLQVGVTASSDIGQSTACHGLRVVAGLGLEVQVGWPGPDWIIMMAVPRKWRDTSSSTDNLNT